MLPPMWLRVRIASPERSGPGVWLPLFLVWLILLPIMVLVLLVTIVVDTILFLLAQNYHHYTALLFRCLEVLGATRGMVVRIHSAQTDVDICFA